MPLCVLIYVSSSLAKQAHSIWDYLFTSFYYAKSMDLDKLLFFPVDDVNDVVVFF